MIDTNKLAKLTIWSYFKLTVCEVIVKILNITLRSNINWLVSINLKQFKYPISLRCGTSDYSCFHVIFIQEEYLSIINKMDTPLDLMVDCGANVGFTARYFLEKFPNLKVICLEPDFSNFVVAKKNLNHYADRINICQNAVWYKPCKTEVIEGHYGNGGKWALQVRETEKEGGVPATDLNIILDGQNADNIFIKIDIEGAEKEVLGKNTKWAKRCNFLAIEVHDEEALKIFNRFADDYNMKNIGLFGEMYLLKNSDR